MACMLMKDCLFCNPIVSFVILLNVFSCSCSIISPPTFLSRGTMSMKVGE